MVNTNRTSSHKPTVFYPPQAKTTKRADSFELILTHFNSFFPYFMAQQSNMHFIYLFSGSLLSLFIVNIPFYLSDTECMNKKSQKKFKT